jgi:hypothetical protein
MFVYPQEGGGMRALVWFLGLLLVGAVVVGILLGNSELINPSLHAAKVDKLEAEAEALRAQTAYEERKHEIELQALQDRRATQLELQAPIIIVGLVAGTVAALCVAGSVAYYFVTKARVLTEGNGPKGPPGTDHIGGPAMPMQGHEGPKGSDPGLWQIERTKVSPWRATHDGLLAYCYDFLLHPGGTVVFYPKGISPDVTEFYRSVLREVRILTRPRDSQWAWALHPRITSLGCIRARISRQAFDRALAEKPIP